VPVSLTVQGPVPAPSAGAVNESESELANLQRDNGWENWENWGQIPPDYVDCSPCSGIEWSATQGIRSPSLSGNATK
jgi:hypothetical protein